MQAAIIIKRFLQLTIVILCLASCAIHLLRRLAARKEGWQQAYLWLCSTTVVVKGIVDENPLCRLVVF